MHSSNNSKFHRQHSPSSIHYLAIVIGIEHILGVAVVSDLKR